MKKKSKELICNPEENNMFASSHRAKNLFLKKAIKEILSRKNRAIRITNISHATLLIQYPVENITILTDPVFKSLNALLYTRRTKTAFPIEQLPKIDIIVISHNHRDHLEESAMKYLCRYQPVVLVPLGVKSLLMSWGFRHVIEHDWWEKTSIPIQIDIRTFLDNSQSLESAHLVREGFLDSEGADDSYTWFATIEITSVPANHWSCRGAMDANLSLFCGWYFVSSLREEKAIYFSGDSALLQKREIKDMMSKKLMHSECVVYLQPGGPNHERDTMQGTHISAADSIRLHFIMSYESSLSRFYEDSFEDDKIIMEEEKIKFIEFYMEKCKHYRTMFMHHNTYELGIDRFNEALFIKYQFLTTIINDIKVEDYYNNESLKLKEIYFLKDMELLLPVRPFIIQSVKDLWEFITEVVGMPKSFSTKLFLFDTIQNNIQSPKIGKTKFI